MIGLLYVIKQTYLSIDRTPNLKRFDPYELLEIDPGTDEKDIKKAYRRLSVIWHPDKNDSPDAAAKFIMITKAYECLTDEKKKVICEKYGNPDGQGSIQVAIAMPSFLLKKENHVKILVLFFVILLVVLPSIVTCWYQ